MIEYNRRWIMMEMRVGMDTDCSSESVADLKILSRAVD
jgi:hypothetical protein